MNLKQVSFWNEILIRRDLSVVGGMQRRVGLEFEFEFEFELDFELDFELQFELNLIKPHFCQKQSGNTTKNY